MLQKVANTEPALRQDFDFASYFAGNTRAVGIVENRFGVRKRAFVARFFGEWRGETFLLHEDFTYCDGATEQRTWQITFDADGRFTTTSKDCVGHGRGAPGPAGCRHAYAFRLPIGKRTITLDIAESYTALGRDDLLCSARMTKWGLRAGTILIAFSKDASDHPQRP